MSEHRHHLERPARRGFTLIEVVLAMGILAIGASVLLSLFSFGALLSSGARLRSEAAVSLELIVADLEERLFPLLPDGSAGEPVDLVDQPVPGRPRLTWSAVSYPDPSATDSNLPTLYRVDIEVTWKADGRRESVTKSVLMPRVVPFGERLRRRVNGDVADST